MVNERPILSGVPLPARCHFCGKKIYPADSHYVHTDGNEKARVYVVCSDCEKANKTESRQQHGPGVKRPDAGKATGTKAGTMAKAGNDEGKKVDKVQTEKELQIMGEITALLNGTGYQMKHGKSGYMFVNSKGCAIMKYLCSDIETALKYAKEIKERKN